MDNIQQLLIACLRHEMTGAPVEVRTPLTEAEAQALFTLAERHDASHIVLRALRSTEALSAVGDTDAVHAMQRAAHLSEYRYLLMTSTLSRVSAALSAQGIDHIPLKGAVLRPLWPTPSSRVSCDIDILVRDTDIARAEACLIDAIGCQRQGASSHDISLFTAENVHIELHFSLVETDVSLPSDAILVRAFDVCLGDGCQKTLPDDFLYTYHIAHMAKHVMNGGCGVRPVLDTWVLCHRVTPDREGRERLLGEGGLDRFARVVETLGAFWIDGGAADAAAQSLGAFLLRGGVYGDATGRVSAHAGRGGRVRYVLSRLFVPYRTLKREFLVLERHPYLLPVFEIYRFFGLLLGRRGRAMRRALLSAERSDTSAWGL